MKIKRVLRYYCDYCKKSGGSKHAMVKHEKHCTMNPARECRMCAIREIMPDPISELLEILDKKGLDALKDAADNCPMCIFATLRQSDKELHEYDFDFKDECDTFWHDINEAERRSDEYAEINQL